MLTSAQSPPARVAWIETDLALGAHPIGIVATREGGVDRNAGDLAQLARVLKVATREGGVDRNTDGTPSWFNYV